MESILIINEIASNNDKVKFSVKSLINPWMDTIVVLKQYREHKTNSIRAYQMRTYLKGPLNRRIRAYGAMGDHTSPKCKAMKSFLHHLNTDYPAGGPKAFMQWMIRREDFILSTLPKTIDKSHDKIKAILLVCKQQTE